MKPGAFITGLNAITQPAPPYHERHDLGVEEISALILLLLREFPRGGFHPPAAVGGDCDTLHANAACSSDGARLAGAGRVARPRRALQTCNQACLAPLDVFHRRLHPLRQRRRRNDGRQGVLLGIFVIAVRRRARRDGLRRRLGKIPDAVAHGDVRDPRGVAAHVEMQSKT